MKNEKYQQVRKLHQVNFQQQSLKQNQPTLTILERKLAPNELDLYTSPVLKLIQQKRLLMFFNRKQFQPHYSTKQCQEMMKKQFSQFVNEHIINVGQEELIENYSLALEKDRIKQEKIKQKLNASFFNKHKQRKNIKQQLRNKFTLSQNKNQQIKNKLAEQLKNSLTFTKSSRKLGTRTPETNKNRYKELQNVEQSIKRPCSNRSSFQQNFCDSPKSKNGQIINFSQQIDCIIDQSNKIHTKTLSKRRNIVTPSERKSQILKQQKNQKDSIISKLIDNDVQEFLKNYSIKTYDFNPELRRTIYEERKRKQLKNFDKYNMSFTSYMKQKTQRNIENSIYNDKIRQKNTYVQKFQRYILDEFKFSEDAKRRLEKIFKAIQLQYKRPIKNRQISERLTPK